MIRPMEIAASNKTQQYALALATSQIHRCREIDELQRVSIQVLPRFVAGDAYGLYLFNERQETEAVLTHQANKKFLAAYEEFRHSDPLLNKLRQHKCFTHTRDLERGAVSDLRDFLATWGLSYTIEAPLVFDGRLVGTMNIARNGERYFDRSSLEVARFLCNEVNFAYQRLREIEQLENRAEAFNTNERVTDLPPRAREVCELLLEGASNSQIAYRLGISENTVRYHVKRIYEGLGVRSRTELLRSAFRDHAVRKTELV